MIYLIPLFVINKLFIITKMGNCTSKTAITKNNLNDSANQKDKYIVALEHINLMIDNINSHKSKDSIHNITEVNTDLDSREEYHNNEWSDNED